MDVRPIYYNIKDYHRIRLPVRVFGVVPLRGSRYCDDIFYIIIYRTTIKNNDMIAYELDTRLFGVVAGGPRNAIILLFLLV